VGSRRAPVTIWSRSAGETAPTFRGGQRGPDWGHDRSHTARRHVLIALGYELVYLLPQATPMILMLNVHYSRASDLRRPDHMITTPATQVRAYRDGFGNWCSRLEAPAGRFRISSEALIHDSGELEPVVPGAQQHGVDALPEEALVFLLGSRYCESDRMYDIAWKLFGQTVPGWARVQAICDFVHHHIEFGYQHASPTKTAWEVFHECKGVCRDYAHLAIALCRAMNVPARYCTGYLGDMGTPPPYGTMDFAGWFEAYLGGHWHTFDARNNAPRIGRVLIARGRDAADVAISTNFGPSTLERFMVKCDEVPG
jgi:transglutaminase-like putative cysteine protease